MVAAAADAALRAGAREVVVGEGPGHRRDTEYLRHSHRPLRPPSRLKLRFVDLNHDDVRRVPLRSRFMDLPDFALPVSVLDADVVVSMPKLKTHHWAGMTCGMKNLFGVVPGAVYGWPKNVLHFHGISNAIVDLVATIRPSLVIVDAIVVDGGRRPDHGQAASDGLSRDGAGPGGRGRHVRAGDRPRPRAAAVPRSTPPSSWATLTSVASATAASAPGRFRFSFEVIESMKELRAQGG